MSEVTNKLQKLRALMKTQNIQGVRLKGVDWFAWATGGGNSVVIFTAEKGIAEVFVTDQKAFVLTNKIEAPRLREEELPPEFEVVAFPWQSPDAAGEFVQQTLAAGRCASDKPESNEIQLPIEMQFLKMNLGDDEAVRYRKIGRLAAEAMTEALTRAESTWSENQLAAEGASALWKRGLDPTLVMVGGEMRVQKHRHPIARTGKLGDYAMMVFCARGQGLYANLTRFIFFREPTPAELQKFEAVARVEAAIFRASVEDQTLASAYASLANAYADVGQKNEIDNHHQGGPTGYLSREWIASPHSPVEQKLKTGMALAWNPSLPGAKIEDTVLMTKTGLEILTVDPAWPTTLVEGRARPSVWIKK